MDRKNIRSALLITSFLLQYPDAKWYELLKDVLEETKNIKHEAYAKPLLKFMKFINHCGEMDLAETYVKSFDFSNKSSLYLTYYLLNDKPERGMAMLKLKQKYANAGFELSGKELPDFLPVVLEFASAANSNVILKEYETVIKAIYDELSKSNNPYLYVLKSVLLIIQSKGNSFSAPEEVGGPVECGQLVGRCE